MYPLGLESESDSESGNVNKPLGELEDWYHKPLTLVSV